MLYLVSTTQHLLAIDTEARQVFRVHSGRGLYYGLAFSGDRIYAACRNETRGPENDTVRANEQGCLLAMDADTLEPIEIVRAPFPLRDMHGLCFHDGRL